MKLLANVVFTAALLVHPVGGDANQSRIGRTSSVPREYPTPQQNQSLILSNEERILLLERDGVQQETQYRILDDHFTQHIKDSLLGQGDQDSQIRQLESRLDVVYRFGGLIAFVLTLSVPFFLWILNKSQAHNAKIATAIAALAKDVQAIKIVCRMKNDPEQGYPCDGLEGEEPSCQS